MYWYPQTVEKIYKGEKDLYNNINECRDGKIKKRTTPGGCACLHRDGWNKIRGYNQRYLGWGSEDFDLVLRARKARIGVKWMGEEPNSIMVFHQPHPKSNEQIKKDLGYQEENKKLLENIQTYAVNPEGWGNVKD
jgi:hypothetical protein